MELYTDRMSELVGLVSARLEERTSGEGRLELEWAGGGPEWLGYMAEVSLVHGGAVVFHGKVVRVRRTNAGGEVRTVAEAENFFWLLERQTLGQQLAELEAEEELSSGSGSGSAGAWQRVSIVTAQRVTRGQIGKYQALRGGASGVCVNWLAATGSMRVSAPGWRYRVVTVADAAEVAEDAAADDEVSVLCSDGVAGRQVWAVTEKLVTTASALWRMRRKAADVQFIVDYTAGTVTAMGIGELERLVIDSAGGALLEASDIEPQWEAAVTGVVIAWTNEAGVTEVHRWPEGLDDAADGVKVFHLTGTYYVDSWETVAQEYYEAAGVLQYGGTVRLLASRLEGSPLGRRLCLVGDGTHESWHEMDAVVTGCSWDLLEGTVTAELGREFADPEFGEAEAVEDGGEYVEEYEAALTGEAAGRYPWLENEGSGSGSEAEGSGSEGAKYSVETVSLREPDGCSPGVDGWALSWQGYVWSGNTNVYAQRRQLMRFVEEGGKVVLQVALQELDASGSWEVAM